MASNFIRPYDPSRDFENGLHVFLTTIGSDVDYDPARTIGSHIWYRPYVTLSPRTCLVLDDGSGRAVGYCIGCADTTAFAQRWIADFAPTIDPGTVPLPGTTAANPAMESEQIKWMRKAVHGGECSALQAVPAELAKFPAHLHIDILPEWQGKGYGTKMINEFLGKVMAEGAGGVHLGMLKTNVKARAFYEKLGFAVANVVLDGGKSGEKGVEGGAITLVKPL